ncbi:MAG TPA: esterase-like activity of phytase family protein [Epsilonproteobacteria bacterium]|nr:esterase-like activity of phytase family protein [Campylobacterota bacterium]
MKVFFFLCGVFSSLYAGISSVNIAPKLDHNTFMGIKILDQKQLSFSKIDGVKFAELSDVTYDTKTHILYFVGDKGTLFAFRAKFSSKIDSLEPFLAKKLRKKNGKRLKKWKRDSEGLTLDGKRRLLISFEGDAKVAWFHKNSQKVGRFIKKYALPKVLRNPKNYRSRNKSLESLAWHPRYGILTASEWPLKKDYKKNQTIYALSGKRWHFKAEPEARSAVVAMEVMDDGNLLIMERSYTGMLEPFVITLKKVIIKNCKKKICPTKVLAKMNSHKGWDIDNFEGLAHVGKNRYVMVSDDGDNFFQKTLLLYFEVR